MSQSGWVQEVDASTGRTFYVNHETQQTSWTPPVDVPLPFGWEERRDEQGRTFFLHQESGKTTWQDPRHASESTPVESSSYPSTGYPSLSNQVSEPRYQLKNSSSSNTWSCNSCTFQNPKSASTCQMCQTARSSGSPTVNRKSSQLESDEAVAAALQADLDREAQSSSFLQLETPAKSSTYQATEPFELLPNMVPDETSTKCLRCNTTFGKLTNRRHHCRCCGMLTCQTCSSKRTVVRLPQQDEKLNEKDQRVCDWCYDHLIDGHAHCFYRYVVVASKEQNENRELAIKGIADVLEHLPQQLSSTTDRAQANRDLEILKFVGGVAKMCSFLSPGDSPSTQAEACRLVAAVASASCVKELESHLPKKQVASELCEGAALSIMSLILQRSPTPKENLSAQISAARVLYLLGDVPALKSAARDAELIPPLCDALLCSDPQLQDWTCMCLGRLLKNDKNSVEEVLKHSGVHNLVLLLSSTNSMIQEHAALALQETLTVDPVNQGVRVKKALSGFNGTPAAIKLLQSSEMQVVSAGLRLLLVLAETEAQQIRSLEGIPLLVSIVVGNGTATDGFSSELQILALQVLKNVAHVSSLDRQAISQYGGLSAAVTLMKSSTNSFVRKEATNLVEALSSDSDGARGVMEASGGISGLVDAVKTNDSYSASSALSQILLQGPEAQAAMLEAGALEALLAAGSKGDIATACRVVESTFSFVSDVELIPKLAKNVPLPTLAQRLIHLGTSLKSVLPGHIMEQLVLTLAVLCGAKADDYRLKSNDNTTDENISPILKATAVQTRALVASNGSQLLIGLIRDSIRPEPGVSLACLRCLLACAYDPVNGDRMVTVGGLPVILQAITDTMKAGDAPDTSSPQTQILLHSISLFARLSGGSRPRDAGRDPDAVKRGLRLLNDALDCHEPECMLTAVSAIRECSFQSGTWSTIAETSLPRCIEMLLADKTGQGPGGRDPLSSSEVLRLLMDVSTITSNLAKLEVHSNSILDSGGVLALISLLSEPEDDATSSGLTALWALSESSKRCAAAISRAETGAIMQLLHLSETHRNKAQASRALKLVRRLAETDAGNAAQIASSGPALDTLLRLVRFEQSEDALDALCALASASDVLWERLGETSDINSTILILEKGGATSSRIQGKSCRGIAIVCERNVAMCISQEVLSVALPIMVKLISPADTLGADKSESPAVDAAWSLASLCQTAVRDGVTEGFLDALKNLNAMASAIQLLMRERRLGRPKSTSTACALRCFRGLMNITNQNDAQMFWKVAENKKEDVFSALVMALDANTQNVGNTESWQAVDDCCWLLASFPEGLSPDCYPRLSRPLMAAFDKSISNKFFRVSCLRAMTRAVREPAIASAMVGAVRNVSSALTTETDSASKIETALLLAALLKGAPNDRIVQDAVASSGAVSVLFSLISKNETAALQALCMIVENGGNAVRKALHAEGEEVVKILKNVIENDQDENWEASSLRDYSFRVLSKMASFDDNRKQFEIVKGCCFKALDGKKCLKPAIELLGWLGTVELEDIDAETGRELEQSLLSVAFDKSIETQTRIEAFLTLEFFVDGQNQDIINFDKDVFLDKNLTRPALQVLERFSHYPGRIDIVPLIPSLLSLTRGVDSESVSELICSCLYEVCRKSQAMRSTLRGTDGLTKTIKRDTVYNRFNAQKLLRVLGEEFSVEKPMVKVINHAPSSESLKRDPDEAGLKKIVNPPPPPPPAAPKSAFPTFTATPSAAERSSLDLAMRLQALETGASPVTSFPRPPTEAPPPSFPSYPTISSKWSCSKCTLENEASSSHCIACEAPKPGSASPRGDIVICGKCGTKLSSPPGSTSVSCPKCHNVTTTGATVKVRCQSCMTELYAPGNAPRFKCSNCGTIGNVRDLKI